MSKHNPNSLQSKHTVQPFYKYSDKAGSQNSLVSQMFVVEMIVIYICEVLRLKFCCPAKIKHHN